MPSTSTVDLVAVDLPAPAAAEAVRRCWDRSDAVFVVPRDLGPTARQELLARAAPTRLIDGAGTTGLDGEPVSDGIAAVVATSGTGTEPKLVELTRSGMAAMASAYGPSIDADERDVWLAALPLSGVAGLAIIARAYEAGQRTVVHDGFELDAVAAATRTTTIVSLVPTALSRLLDADVALDRFRVVLLGGAPIPAALRARAESAGVRLVTSYGMTETWGGIVLDGLPLPGATVTLSARGEVLLAGPMLMARYRGDETATAAAFTGDGSLRSGDLGEWRSGRLHVIDRLSDTIIAGGVSVSPSAVEAALSALGVDDFCVVGLPDVDWGEVVTLVVVGEAPTLEDVRAAVADHLPRAAVPRRIRSVAAIPRTASGKPRRRALAAMLAGG